MELPDLGKHCVHEACKLLDFLPFKCKCGKIFCSEHFQVHVEICEKSRFIPDNELKNIENILVCSNEKCTEKSILPLICQRCNKHFCIKHRHLTDCNKKSKEEIEKEKIKYMKPVLQFIEAKAKVDKQINEVLFEAKKNAKHKEMAAKIQLMKIKNKAIGQKSIPTIDRVYFSVTYNFEKVLQVFVSKTWSIGRVIDAIALECKLQNSSKTVQQKLRLFKKEDKQIVSNEMSSTIANLLENKIITDGEDLIIEYVDNDCIVLN